MIDMSVVLFAFVSLLGTTILTSVVGLLLKRSFDKYFQKRDKELEELSELREHKAHEERETIKNDMKDAIEEVVKPIKEDLIMIKKGTQAGLRHDLAIMADEWLMKGYCPRNVKDDFNNIYTQYHQLGKNGVMDNLYHSILGLPEGKPKPKTTTKPRTTNKPTSSTQSTSRILNE